MLSVCCPGLMEGILPLFEQIVLYVRSFGSNIYIQKTGGLKAADTIRTMVYPGFPTDAQAIIMAPLCTAEGTTVFVENIFENRFMFASELVRMGAAIRIESHHAMINGGKGVSGVNLKEDDVIDEMFIASTHEYVLFFSSKGKVYRLKVHELPVGTRQARGTAIVNLLPFEEGEKIASVISCREFPADEYLMFATKSGMVKKTVMSAYDRSRRDGLAVVGVLHVAGGEDAFDRGLRRSRLDLDVAFGVERQLFGEKFRVGVMADRQEESRDVDLPLRAVVPAQQRARYARVVAQHLGGVVLEQHFDVRRV